MHLFYLKTILLLKSNCNQYGNQMCFFSPEIIAKTRLGTKSNMKRGNKA